MSELHSFLFDGLPVRGMVVRLTDAWTEVLERRATYGEAYPTPVGRMLGQMAAAGVLMQANIRFKGSLILQIYGDGPLRMSVVEVQPDLALRATATLGDGIQQSSTLTQLINRNGNGRCAITLDPHDRRHGQQPYQGVVSLNGDRGERLEQLSVMLEQYMRRSEQLETKLVLAANHQVAAGILIQRLPTQGEANLGGHFDQPSDPDTAEHFRRISILAASISPEELLNLSVDTVLHRLFWQEKLSRFAPVQPRFACNCSHARVAGMLRSLGREEVEDILSEQGHVDIGCDFCGAHYRFDAVDVASAMVEPLDKLNPSAAPMQ